MTSLQGQTAFVLCGNVIYVASSCCPQQTFGIWIHGCWWKVWVDNTSFPQWCLVGGTKLDPSHDIYTEWGAFPWQRWLMPLGSVAEQGGWLNEKNRRASCPISPPSSPSWGWQDRFLSPIGCCGSNLKLVPCKRVWGVFLKSVGLKQDSVAHGVGQMGAYICQGCVWVRVFWGDGMALI